MENNQETPLLTVVLPIYNGEEHLGETLGDILKSSYYNIEVLLIDDGSQDGSGEICAAWETGDDRVRYIRKQNGGIVSARNRGLKEARGEYICFCDQDDVIKPEMYQSIMDALQKECAQIGMCSTGRMINGKVSEYERLEDGCYDGEQIWEYLLYPLLFRGYRYPFVMENNYLYGTLWKCIFQLSLLKQGEMKFQKFISYEDDWLFVTEALALAQRVCTISSVGYIWRVNDGSASHNGRYLDKMEERFEKLDRQIDSFLHNRGIQESVLTEYHKIRYCEHYLQIYDNYSLADKKLDKKEAFCEIEGYLTRTKYKERLSCRRNLKKSAFRKTCFYGLLARKQIKQAAALNRFLLWLEAAVGSIPWITKLERWIKKQ